MSSRLCACGRRCHSTSARCLTCNRNRQPFSCEWCGVSFRRKPNPHDACRFCSKKCSGALRTAGSAPVVAAFARTFRRELQQALASPKTPIVRLCRCGAPITQWRTGWCDPCLLVVRGASIRAGHSVARLLGVAHICPNCGRSFKGYQKATYCSTRCATQMRKRIERGTYPVIGHLQIDERNKLAELIALTRAVNRRLHRHG